MKFRVLEGSHTVVAESDSPTGIPHGDQVHKGEKEFTYHKGQIVTTDQPLDKLFPGKFEFVDEQKEAADAKAAEDKRVAAENKLAEEKRLADARAKGGAK